MSLLRPVDRWFIDEILPHEEALISAAQRIERDPDTARDLVHDVYAKLMRMEGWATIAHPRHYALRMIRNLALERLRRSKIVQIQCVADLSEMDIIDDQPCQFRVAAARKTLDRISEALAAMPERCRTVLVRRRFDDQSPAEIAQELGISVSTMEKRLARAMVLLAQALANAVDEEPAARNGDDEGAEAVNS